MKSNKKLHENISIKEQQLRNKNKKQLLLSQRQSLGSNISKSIKENENISVIDSQKSKLSQIQSFKQFTNDKMQSNNEYKQNETNKMSQSLQKQKIQQLNHNLSSLSVSVSHIKSQYTELQDSQNKILLTSRIKQKSKLDDPKIVQFLQQKQKNQKNHQNRRLSQVSKLQKKRNEQYQTEQQRIAQKRLQQLNLQKKKAFFSQKIKRQKQVQQIKQKQASQIFKKYKNSTPLFQIKQKQSLQNQIKKADMIRQYLKSHRQSLSQIKQKYMSQKSIQQFQKWHLQTKTKLQQQKQVKKLDQLNRIEQQNGKLKNLYKGKISQLVLQQIKQFQEKKEIPFKLKQKIRNYQENIKLNFKPKINLKQRQLAQHNKIQFTQLNNRQLGQLNKRTKSSSLDLKMKRDNKSTHSFRQLKRYRYLRGVSFGQIVQERPLAKSYQDERRTGKGYLQFMKSLPKKRNINPNISLQLVLPKPALPNHLLHKRKKRPFISINSQPTRQQINAVLQHLRFNDQQLRLKEKMVGFKGSQGERDQDRRELNDGILFSLESKLDLLAKLDD